MISFLYYTYAVVLSTLNILLALVLMPFTLLFNRRRRLVHEMCRRMVRIFFESAPSWRREIKGLEHIDKGRSYVIVANHQSMVDIIAMYYVPLHFKWVSKREVYFTPMFGQYLWLQGNITIDRKSGRASITKILREGKKWLSQGVSIAIFPEGTRTKSGEIGVFKSGAFSLAAEAGVDILPVVVDGTKSLFKGKFYLNWGNVLKVTVLPAITAEQIAATDQKELMDRVKSDMAQTLKKMREE